MMLTINCNSMGLPWIQPTTVQSSYEWRWLWFTYYLFVMCMFVPIVSITANGLLALLTFKLEHHKNTMKVQPKQRPHQNHLLAMTLKRIIMLWELSMQSTTTEKIWDSVGFRMTTCYVKSHLCIVGIST